MGGRMYTYCLYCEAGKCGYVAIALASKMDCQVIIPKQVQHTWDKGKMVNRVHNLFPGYLFLYSEQPLEMSHCLKIPGVVRCLSTGEDSYELHGTDEKFALFLLDKNGIIGKVLVTEQDGMLEISPESLRRADVSIIKVDRRNTRMQIEIRLFRHTLRTWIEYEIAEAKEQEGIEQGYGSTDNG